MKAEALRLVDSCQLHPHPGGACPARWEVKGLQNGRQGEAEAMCWQDLCVTRLPEGSGARCAPGGPNEGEAAPRTAERT